MRDSIVAILRDINPYVDIDEDTNLIEEDILDSIGIVLLLQQIEEELGVVVPQEDVDIDDFANIDSIISLVSEKGKVKDTETK